MLEKAPNTYELMNLFEIVWNNFEQAEVSPGKWVPARPLGMHTLKNRLKTAWLVFTGKADAVVWPGQ